MSGALHRKGQSIVNLSFCSAILVMNAKASEKFLNWNSLYNLLFSSFHILSHF